MQCWAVGTIRKWLSESCIGENHLVIFLSRFFLVVYLRYAANTGKSQEWVLGLGFAFIQFPFWLLLRRREAMNYAYRDLIAYMQDVGRRAWPRLYSLHKQGSFIIWMKKCLPKLVRELESPLATSLRMSSFHLWTNVQPIQTQVSERSTKK